MIDEIPWPHAPTHRLSEAGTFMVTADTYRKAGHFRDPARLEVLERGLIRVAAQFGRREAVRFGAATTDDATLAAAVQRHNVFARVTPKHKLALVRALQANGEVVAMTGDGVNDAPALKQADIGVAMGKNGTDVARSASAMDLTDDNFATIAAAVQEGRAISDNLVKFIAWALPTNGGSGLVLLAAVALQTTLPVLPVQLLWANLATALLGTTLIFEAREPGIMQRAPRPATASILDRALAMRIVLVSFAVGGAAFGCFEWAQLHGVSDAASSTRRGRPRRSATDGSPSRARSGRVAVAGRLGG